MLPIVGTRNIWIWLKASAEAAAVCTAPLVKLLNVRSRTAFVGRKQRKREFRKLWILRINAGARENGLSYSKLMFGLAQAGVALNRKVLADLAVRQKEDFAKLVELARTKLA